MFKLMKYEFIKQKMSKYILGGFLLFAELLYLGGLLFHKNSMISIGIIALTITALAGFIIVALETIFTYYQDMKEKRGYMLFMTPHSVFEIIGSKMISGIIVIFIWMLLIVLLAFIDVTLLAVTFNEVDALFEMLQSMASSFFSLEISWTGFIIVVLNAVFQWCAMVTSAFLAITLSMTFLSRMKMKGLISFVIYVILNLISARLITLIQTAAGISGSAHTETAAELESGIQIFVTTPNAAGSLIAFIVTLFFGILCFLGTAQLLKKKLSL